MASTFLQINQIDEASQCLLRATDFDFTNAAAHYYLGICCALRRRYEDAAEFFLHTLDIDANNSNAARSLAVTYFCMGRSDDASQVIANYPLSADDADYLRRLERKIRLRRFAKRLTGLFKPLKSLRLRQK
jgi:tetratricopeptide (TPR) repeat protein